MVKIGDVLSDNDPRSKGRTVKVTGVTTTHAEIENETGRKSRVSLDRVHNTKCQKNGLERKSGFTILREWEVPGDYPNDVDEQPQDYGDL